MANLIGAAWMVAAMAFFALVDVAMKLSTQSLPVSQIITTLGLTGVIGFGIAARLRGLSPMPAALFRGAALVRSLGEATASSLVVFALGAVPLALFTTIIQANPLLVVLGAALFFGEPVGWRRWIAVGIGLVGVLIVLRPGTEGLTSGTLLVVLAVLAQAVRDLATRKVSADVHTLQLSVGAFLALTLAGIAIALVRQTPPVMPEGAAWAYLLGGCLMILPAVYTMVASMRIGDVAFVAPFRYTRIVFGLAFGVLLFDETLDGYMILGAVIIVTSGLYALVREARLKRRNRASNPPPDPL